MTGRQYAIMFFGLAVPYLNVLQIFDRLDGLRRLYNSVSTLTMFREDMDLLDLDDDEEHIQRQMIRSSLTTLKAYAEAHLAIRNLVNKLTLKLDQCFIPVESKWKT